MQTRNRLVLALLVGLWTAIMGQRSVVAMGANTCDEICAGGAYCSQECWLTQFDFDQDYPPTTCGDQSYSCCGDGMCDTSSEACGICTADCGEPSTCGPAFCTNNSDCASGEACNSQHKCVAVAPNTDNDPDGPCRDNNACYTNDTVTAGRASRTMTRSARTARIVRIRRAPLASIAIQGLIAVCTKPVPTALRPNRNGVRQADAPTSVQDSARRV